MIKKNGSRYSSTTMLINALIVSALLLTFHIPSVDAQRRRPRASSKDATVDWPAYGSDAGGSRYSPLAQINQKNVAQLKVAWTYHTGTANYSDEMRKKAAFEATPILIDGTLYLSTPDNRIIALDPASGAERWTYDPHLDSSRFYSEVTSRGVATWPQSHVKGARRIFLGTLDARLIALDAATGKPCPDFGDNGQIDLTRDVRLLNLGKYQNYQVTSPPAVIGDSVIVGSSIGDNVNVQMERGVVRAYDVRTGALRWTWDPIPQQVDDPALKTWAGESAKRTGAANAWSIISVDPARNLVFVPTGSPSPDFYGGERLGNNSYANSVVALDAATGKVVWHFQVVHHDLWDYDVAAQPMLIDLTRAAGQSKIPAVVVATKMGHIFVLNRETGAPLFPVEERPVPASDVPGEKSAATQPFPITSLALVPQKLTPDDAWGATAADRAWCRERIGSLRAEGIFTPPSLKGTVVFPGNVGGVNWGGMAFDREHNTMFAATNRLATVVKLIPRAEFQKSKTVGEGDRLKGEFGAQTGAPFGMYREPLLSPQGLPCNAPPWGALSAIDLTNGALKWEVPLGTISRLANIPGSSQWGSINLGGPIVTAGGLVFIAAAMDENLRAFDVQTGKELWSAQLSASAQATPMTYQIGGKQFVVIAAGGHGKLSTKMGDAVVAYALQ